MGCWNETCMLSNLPIVEGDECVEFLLVPNHEPHHQIYTVNDQYSPIGFPIRGKYDAYGRLSKNSIVKNFSLEWTYHFIVDLCDKDKLSYNDSKEHKEVSTDIIDILKAVERGYLQIKKDSHLNTVCSVFMHQKIYNTILNNVSNRKVYDKDFSIKDLLVRSAHKFINTKRDKFGMINSNSYFYQCFKYKSMYDFFMLNLHKKKDTLIDIMVELLLFEIGLNYSRMCWRTMPGKGSQCQEFCIPGLISDFVKSKIDERIKETSSDEFIDNPLQEQFFNIKDY